MWKKIPVVLFVIFAAACGGSKTPLSPVSSGSQDGQVPPYFVDLRGVAYDISNLPPGKHVISFPAYVNTWVSKTWTNELQDKLKQEVVVLRVGNTEATPVTVTFVPIVGRPDAEMVSVVILLDKIGTWQASLPTSCYDPGGKNAGELAGPLLPSASPFADRPVGLVCAPSAVRTVGSCRHVAYSQPISKPAAKGAQIWRVEWSEPLLNATNGGPQFTGKATTAAGGNVAIPVAAQDVAAARTEISFESPQDTPYVISLQVGDQQGVALDFPKNWSCTVGAGALPVAESDAFGRPDASLLPWAYPGKAIEELNKKQTPAKADAGS